MRDGKLEEQLCDLGYAVVPFLDATSCKELMRWRQEVGLAPGDPGTGLFNDTWSTDPGHREMVAARLGEAFSSATQTHLSDQTALAWTTVTKWPGSPGAVPAHRDPTFVDERRHRSVGVWCALEDVDVSSGPLIVVPGTHQQAPVARSHQSDENLVLDLDLRCHRSARELALCAGEAVIYDHGLVHGSAPNIGHQPRVVAVGVVVPERATPSYLLRDRAGRSHTVQIGPRFFIDHQLDQLDVDSVLAGDAPPASSDVTTTTKRRFRWLREAR